MFDKDCIDFCLQKDINEGDVGVIPVPIRKKVGTYKFTCPMSSKDNTDSYIALELLDTDFKTMEEKK